MITPINCFDENLLSKLAKLIACVFLSLVALATGILEEESCYKSVALDICSSSSDGKKKTDSACNARYSGFSHVHDSLQQFVMTQIEQSFQYLTMATKFGNYKSNRPGFEKLYRKLADNSWEESIELMKYITSRGYDIDLKNAPHSYSTIKNLGDVSTYAEISELRSLSLALEMNKFLAEKAHDIHRYASKMGHVSDNVGGVYHDAEVMSYLENEYVHKHAETIRTLTGHVNDLHKITLGNGTDAHLATFMFDEFLLKA